MTGVGLTPYELMYGRKPRELSLVHFKATVLDSVNPFTKDNVLAALKQVEEIREELKETKLHITNI